MCKGTKFSPSEPNRSVVGGRSDKRQNVNGAVYKLTSVKKEDATEINTSVNKNRKGSRQKFNKA